MQAREPSLRHTCREVSLPVKSFLLEPLTRRSPGRPCAWLYLQRRKTAAFRMFHLRRDSQDGEKCRRLRCVHSR